MDLDPAHLRSFLAIVRYGGYHRAAEALHLTQPAVSRHIRRLEDQLGHPLFSRRGRGVELTSFGSRAASELGEVLIAHDRALTRLQRTGGEPGPFVLGTMENLVDPVLPDMLAGVRSALDGRPLQLRIDRSRHLVGRLRRGEVDAAVVVDPMDVEDAAQLGTLTLRWFAAPAAAATPPAHGAVPLVAYDPPCILRERALERLAELGLEPRIMAESPHLSGVHAAVRNGLGYALLAAGGDGLRAISTGPLAEPIEVPVWFVAAPEHAELAAALRPALRRAALKSVPVAA